MKKLICFLSVMLVLAFSFNVYALDCTKKGWGQGYDVNDMNQPIGCINYKDIYSQYDALFISNYETQITLTFDEGYENGYTSSILDTLKEKNVKAIFFITYDYAERNSELVKRMIDEGHVVGNHTTTHPSMANLSQEKLNYEVMTLHQYIKSEFNYDMHLLRPPMGEFSEQSLAYTQQLGYKSVFWSFAYKDYDVNNQPNRSEALNRINSSLHPGAIYLLHAVSKTNCEILGEFIDNATQSGYSFTTEL